MQSCHHKHATKTKNNFTSFLPAIAMAILPKCSFCIMAYSGAMSLCSGQMLYPNKGVTSTYVFLVLSLVILLGIVLNRRGKRTWIALLIASLGIGLLILSQFYTISQPLYYLSVGVLFLGIWMNGSFLYFWRKYINKLKSFDHQYS